MTSTIRCIVLLSTCALWTACDDPKSARPEEETKQVGAAEAMRGPQALAAPVEALAATAPEPLKSVADAPTAQQETAHAHAPEPEAEQDPRFDRALEAGEVQISRFVLAGDVMGREPVDVRDSFANDVKIFAFVELANVALPYAFRVHWEPVDGPSSPYGVELKVRTAERFRTWSWTAIERKPGRYRAVLRTLDGQDIASRELEITDGNTE